MDIHHDLAAEHIRRQTVLWLRGTGLHAWPFYFAFLECFTLEQLAQFKQIIGTSGGAGVLWLYVCAQTGHFDVSRMHQFDATIRGRLNESGLMLRLARCILLKSPYLASHHLALLQQLVSPTAFNWSVRTFPLSNFRVLTGKGQNHYCEFGAEPEHEFLRLSDVLALGGTPRSGQDIYIPEQKDALYDFENCTQSVRRRYREELATRYPETRKVVLNTRVSRPGDFHGFEYVRLSDTHWPRVSGAVHLLRLLLDLPHRDYHDCLLKAREQFR